MEPARISLTALMQSILKHICLQILATFAVIYFAYVQIMIVNVMINFEIGESRFGITVLVARTDDSATLSKASE